MRALLCDRDGTLIEDVPYNADPDRVVPRRGVGDALERARRDGVLIGVITNQSGVARGFISDAQLAAVHERLIELLGPFDVIEVCRHGPDEGCACRKPTPGLVFSAAQRLGVSPEDCLVVGDRAEDVEAGLAAGALAVLVPSGRTSPAALRSAPVVRPDVASALHLLRERV